MATTTPSLSGTGSLGGTGASTDLTVPPLGSLTPTSPKVTTYDPSNATGNVGTATAAPVGMLSQAQASLAAPLAKITNGKFDPNDNTNAASQLDAITSENSPYIQLAEQQGLLTAASRGLENSSLGAGAAEASAVAAAAPLATQNAGEAAQGVLQNSQLGTQANEFNASQDAAAKELQAQLETSTSQSNAQLQTSNNEFNAQQTQAAAAANAAAQNTMAAQTAALTEDLNKQDLSGTQAARLAQIQAQSNQLIASNQSAASLYTTYMSSISATLANKDIAPQRVADTITAMQSMLQSGLGVIDAMDGMQLDLTLPSTSGTSGRITTTPPPTKGNAPLPGATKTTTPVSSNVPTLKGGSGFTIGPGGVPIYSGPKLPGFGLP